MRHSGAVGSEGDLLVRPLRVDDEQEAIAAHRELAEEGFDFLEAWTPEVAWTDYVQRLGRMSLGQDLPQGWVPFTLLAGDASGVVVGTVSIRHQLTAHLAEVGGHIGYAVRPRYRRRGYATRMLQHALQVAAALGIESALLTCDDDNLASAAVIERCGGVLERVLPATENRPAKRHYWIASNADCS